MTTIFYPLANPLAWLKSQDVYPKAYVRQGEEEFAALGAVKICHEIPNEKERYFGGVQFQENERESLWEDFPPCYFFLPAIEVHKKNGMAEITVRTSLLDWEKSLSKSDGLNTHPQGPISRSDNPNFSTYQNIMEAISKAREEKGLKKIVLARHTSFTFERALCPYSQLARLGNEGCFSFLFQLSPSSAFIGATPEYLYQKKGLSLMTYAVAGTRKRGIDDTEDRQFERDLLESDKEQREFRYVVDDLVDKLSPFSESLSVSDPYVLKTGRVQHLHATLQALISHPISDQQWIKRLHPTAATGGVPQTIALDMIRDLEPFKRGWYAAPVGFVSREHSLVLVAIRSALIKKNLLHLFAGSGIVLGSTADAEWRELDNKIRHYLQWETSL